MNKRTMAFLLGSVLLCHASLVYGEVPDYNTVVENTQKENKAVQMFETDDGKGNTVQVAAHQETLYVTARKTGIYTMPSDSSAELAAVSLGDQVEQTAICDNGWSKVEAEADGEKVIGYIQTQALNSENQIVSMDAEEVEVTSDSSILDYPGKKDGEVVGEVLELDEVKRTGTVNNVWSRIEYQNADGTEQEGYIPTSCLNVSDGQESTEASIDTKKDAGTLHKSSGKGVFSDALETDESVTDQKDGTAINITYTTPDDSDYSVEAVAAGRTAVEDGLYSVEDNVITLSGDLKPGSYTFTFSDDKYASKKSSTLVESGLEEGSVSIENNVVVIADNEQGLTGADYAAQVTSVVVNGEPVKAKGIAGILFNEDGSINMDAEIEGQDGNVKVFDGSDSYEIELEATGYPSVKGTVTAQ